jgi:hypothetical protein
VIPLLQSCELTLPGGDLSRFFFGTDLQELKMNQLRVPHEDSTSFMILGGAKQVMHDFGEYLRAYWVYVSTSLGLGKALAVALMWVAGIFIPLGAKTFLQSPSWLMLAWMAGWGLLSCICAPFGMWKQHRAQIASLSQPDRNVAV